MKNSIHIILLLLIGLHVSASDTISLKRFNLLSFRQIEAGSPWLQSNNAAGLSQMPDLFPSEIKLGMNLTEGDFHTVFQGKSIQAYDFSSHSFQKINKTYLYGSFNYRKSYEKGLNFSNTNDPVVNYPYLLTDTIGNDTYDREFFKLIGIISSPISNKVDWGLSFDYEVGVAAQNRDPRPENKVLQLNISPGLLFKTNHYKVGATLNYGYYNEDIDISVVEENVQYAMFQLHGPGITNYHVSNSFYRLYQQHRFGGGMQFEYVSGRITNLLHSNYTYSIQNIDDGRKASTATWSVVKKDAQLDGINWDLTNVTSLTEGNKTHQLKASLQIENRRGTEFIQRLEKIGETDLEHWITYAKEQKYYSLRTQAELAYLLLGKNDDHQMNSLLGAGMKYSVFEEKYYLPNLHQNYSNLMFSANYLKMFELPKANFSAEIRLKYQLNIEKEQVLIMSNSLVQHIFLPEFNFLTDDYLSPGFALGYEFPLKKIFNKYFIKADFDWYRSNEGHNRILSDFSTGLIF